MKPNKSVPSKQIDQGDRPADIGTYVGVDMSGSDQSAAGNDLSALDTKEPASSEPLVVEFDMGPVEPEPSKRKTTVLGPNLENLGEIDTPEEDLIPAKPKPRFRQLMVLMERSFFALSKTRTKPIVHVGEDSLAVRVEAGHNGMATIYDADLLMFLIGKLSAEPDGRQTALLRPPEFFEAVGSTKGGDQYRLLEAALDRLLTTKITTNASPAGTLGHRWQFSWLELVARVTGGWEVQVSDWVREGGQSNYLLSVSPEYFGLSGLERFLYLKARKHTGRSFGAVFPIGTDTLYARSGSAGQKARFKHEVREIAKRNALPDYCLTWRERGHGKAALIEMHRDGLTGKDRMTRGPRF